MQISFVDAINQVPAAQWNNLCARDYPFVRHEFLQALETSGSLGEGTGWQPQHLLVKAGGELVAAMPMYLKDHSYGEYVFDWAWADAYRRYGLDYYPKLVNAIPFTPCSGPRLLCNQPADTLLPHIIPAIQQQAQHLRASSWHCLFPESELSAQLASEHIAQRMGTQFHWFNRGYKSWDDFVGNMNSRKRKNINKERRLVAEQGIYFVHKTGADIGAEDWQLFYRLYRNTYLKRSGHSGYLTEAFFLQLGKCFAQHSLLVIAHQQSQPIAAALFFKDASTIYGRYWGCVDEYNFLHFETCYYQGIDYAIQHQLQRFDGGAQGEHKIQRGFEPVITWSNHWLARVDFAQAIDGFLAAEKKSIEHYMEDARQYLPFKHEA